MVRISTLCLFVIAAVSVQGQHPCLLNHWPMDGNANDVTTNPNNGTVVGATLTIDRFNNPNSAYSFDGVDDYIDLQTFIPDLTSLSLSVWVKYTGTGHGIILCDADNVSNNDFYLDFAGTGIGIKADKGAATLNYSNGTAVTGLNNLDQWNHVVWVLTPNLSEIYLNGNVIHSVTDVGSQVGFHPNHAAIGVFYHGTYLAGTYFEGVMDDLQLYDCILDSAEIDSIYNYTPIGIKETANNTSLNIYPNPTGGVATIQNSGGRIQNVQVFDLFGRPVPFEFDIGRSLLDIRSSPAGVYFVRVGDAVRKLILN